LNPIERLRATLACAPVDRPAYSFWTHLPGIDMDAARLAKETAAFARRYQLDCIKSMPNGFYVAQAWGCPIDFSDIERGGVARVITPAVTQAPQWHALARPGLDQPDLARELDHLARLVAAAGPEMPVLATVFSPLTTASKLSAGASTAHARTDAQALHAGLAAITEVTCAFARAAIERGCAGIFLALQDATADTMSAPAYAEFGTRYDLQVLAAARAAGSWFDALHVHGENILFDAIAGYPVDALNWHIGETPPSIADYLSRVEPGEPRKAILGGLQRMNITRMDRAQIAADLERSIAQSGQSGLIVAPACVIRHPVDAATLDWLAATIRGEKV
jgi:uroporphyrinogen decarboxylase